MKKYLIACLMVVIPFCVHAQTVKYVIFTSVDENAKYGVEKSIEETPNDMNSYRIYQLFITQPANYGVMFIHANQKGQSNQPAIESKSLSFLNTISWDDLDVGQPMTKEQIKAKYEHYCTYDKLYFIDRREITSTTITLVEVLPLKKTIKYY